MKQEENLVKEYVDSNYWKIELIPEQSIDDLLAEFENWKPNAWYIRSFEADRHIIKAASNSAYL